MTLSWRKLRAACTAAVAAAIAVAHADDTYFEGDGTTYTLGDTSSGNCNFMAAPAGAATHYAALNNDQWLSTKNCGRCAEVACSDARCTSQKKEVVHILDRCPECKHGDLDLSPTVFASITGSGPSRLQIKWRFVDCPVSGGIQYCLKGGSNAFWTAIQPANTVAGVRSMSINGQTPTMVDSAYYYLLNGASVTQTDLSRVKVALTSVGGETIEETVALTAGACTTGKQQFKAGGSSGGGGGGSSQQTTSAPATTSPPATTTTAPTPPPPTKAPSTSKPTPAAQNEIDADADATRTPTPTPTPTARTNSTTGGNGFSMDGLLGADSAQPGKVSAPDDASSSVVKRLTTAPAATSIGETAGPTTDNVQTVTTKSSETAGSTSPLLIALAVAGVVGAIALAVVAAISRKKKLDDKRADQRDGGVAMQRSFDTFASPVRVHSEIAQL